MILKVENLSVRYGAVEALSDLSFEIETGQIVALLGSNGAGKTTTLKALSNLVRPHSGKISFRGESIAGVAPHELVRRGLVHAPEGRGIFLNLSVEENLDLGAWASPKPERLREDLEHVYELFPRLSERRKQNAGTLSGGEQQMLAIGRALLAHPMLLLLDEPSLGLAPQVIDKIFEIIEQINREGRTILLVEQNAKQALEIAHQGMVLETGRLKLRGPARELLGSDEVRKAYLGG
jgi:branched-chain amino acid transport system ATP-binding protein